ncbi:MAG: glutamate--cysteine ligase [Proteobacteria bacterium]|nr:glutamate--cysteine ligase [Pseudomonadota bacterium]
MSSSTISAPLKQLEQLIVSAFANIEAWLREEYSRTPPPFYCSTDLRNNGYKIAPVDTNLFPGGFNNLSPANYPLAVAAIRHQTDILCPNAKSLLLIPENHTRNLAYLDNVATLKQLIEMAGIHVKIGRIDGNTTQVTSANGTVLEMDAVRKENGRLYCQDFMPCAVLLNNDLSNGVPPLLENIEIPILPPPQLGWALRKKSQHFSHYTRVAEQFAELLQVDPWLFSADFHVCKKIDFQKREGMECLAAAIDETLTQVQEKYRQHGIEDESYVVLKANAGTYGMGIMMVKDAAAVFNLNRKQRNKMATNKENAKVQDVLIQEGIATLDSYNEAAAEPVVYMIGGATVGGFYRVNATRSSSDNLNSGGMSFSPLPFETNCAPPMQKPSDHVAARLYVYSVIGRLANLAAAREVHAVNSIAD